MEGGVASPAVPRPLPPPPPEISSIYREIEAKSRYWADLAYRHFRNGYWLLVGLTFVLVASLVVLAIRLSQTRPGLTGPWGTPAETVAIAISLEVVVIVLASVQLRHFRGLWDRVASGAIPPTKSIFGTPPEREIRKWLSIHEAGGGGATSSHPPSDLTRALTLLRFGQFLGDWVHRLVATQFVSGVLLGWLGILVLAFQVGALDPGFPGFLITLAVGPIVVLLLSAWFLVRANREIEQLSRRFAPLSASGAWLEQMFWTRF